MEKHNFITTETIFRGEFSVSIVQVDVTLIVHTWNEIRYVNLQ